MNNDKYINHSLIRNVRCFPLRRLRQWWHRKATLGAVLHLSQAHVWTAYTHTVDCVHGSVSAPGAAEQALTQAPLLPFFCEDGGALRNYC